MARGEKKTETSTISILLAVSLFLMLTLTVPQIGDGWAAGDWQRNRAIALARELGPAARSN